jgi:hypothetical protein
MVQKCANPACSTSFRYFRDGRLYSREFGASVEHPGKRHLEYFWLCGPCSAHLTLRYDPQRGMIVVPLDHSLVRRAAA